MKMLPSLIYLKYVKCHRLFVPSCAYKQSMKIPEVTLSNKRL